MTGRRMLMTALAHSRSATANQLVSGADAE
ncbi:hypothetical protein J2S43_000985 [Catenuloplanes nepalensis]|uniref:Uncharacterized protein n=1 Tax=Catenuloplanes nepalensis TaxID=587533 RepID=A0ABT9MM25_9ACTN|nr:hypothetical protein [Catenuloplanes nepalensis]